MPDYIWSIDVGHRNLGLAILEVSNDISKALDYHFDDMGTCPDKTKLLWRDVKVVYKGTHDAWNGKSTHGRPTLSEINTQLGVMIDTLTFTAVALNMGPSRIIIEDQPLLKYKGKTNVAIQWFIQGMMTAWGFRASVVSPKLKISKHTLKTKEFHDIFANCDTLEAARQYTYYQRKTAATNVAKLWSDFLGPSTYDLRRLSSTFRGANRPDSCDALLQLLGLFGQIGVNNDQQKINE